MSKCKICKEKENLQGYWYCQECKDIKDHTCKCGAEKSANRSYCRPCANVKTKQSQLRTGRVINGKRKLHRKKSDIQLLNKELILFVEYIKEKGAIDFNDINDVFSIYERYEDMDLLQGLRDNVRIPSVESMWKVLKKIYDLEKNDFL